MPLHMSWLSKAVGLAYVYNTVSETITNLFGETDGSVSTVRNIVPRKKSDTTKYTQYMYDFIICAHDDFIQYNFSHPKNKKTTEDLTKLINERMGTNKSRTALSRVWLGHVDRDDLPVGKPYFDY